MVRGRDQTAAKSLGTPNPCATPPPTPQSHLTSRSPKVLSSLPAGARTPEAVTGQDSCPAPLQSRGWGGGREWTEPCGGPRGIQLRGATGRCCPQRPAHPTVSPASTLATDAPSAPSFLHLPPRRGGGKQNEKIKKKKPNPPINAKQTFLCHFLSSWGLRGRTLPGGLGCG